MLLAALPDGYAARVPTIGDAESVTDLTAECRFAVGDRSGMTVEELLGDWQDIALSEEAVAVEAPDGRLAAYADVLNRSYVSISVYGYVHPEHRGLGAFIVGWGEEWVRERLHLAPGGARVVVQHYVHTADEPAARLMPETRLARGFG
jgi:GNAT superfamily N-acetyltransferase